jgi:hypothetical protein
MCVYPSVAVTNKIKNGPNSFIAYKVIKVMRDKIGHRNVICSVCFSHKWTIGENKSGHNEADIKLDRNLGIHIFLNKDKAKSWILYDIEHIMPVRVYKKDLIVGGSDEDAVFTKVYVTKQSYQKVLNLKRKKKC